LPQLWWGPGPPAPPTTRSPVSLPARCLEKPAQAKAPPAEAATVGKDETAINAKLWVYAMYFNRMKAKLREQWKPADEYQRRNPDVSRFGEQFLLTQLQVTVRPDGWLERVTIERSSGLDFLDHLAIEAFERAQPFGDPPCNLLKDTGLLHFRFGFAFDTKPSAASVREAASSP
jgi:TonB family protein